MFKGSIYYKLTLISLITMAASSIGIIQNVSGIFFLPMSIELNAGIASLSLTLTLSSLATGFSSPFMIRFMVKRNFIKIMRLGVVVAALSTILMAFSSRLSIIYILSIVRGIATSSFALAPIVYLINHWFEEKHGFVTGLVMSFTGITGVILNPIINAIIVSTNWRYAMGFSGLLIFVLTFLGTLWLKPHPKDRALLAYGAHEIAHEHVSHQNNLKLNVNFFFILLAIYTILSSSLTSMIQHFPTYSLSIQQSASTGALMVSAAMVGNLSFKFILGILSDRLGIIKASLVIATTYLIAQISFNFLPIQNSQWILLLMSLLMGSVYSAVAVGIPLLTKYFYPKEDANIVYASLTSLISIGSASGVVLMGLIYDVTQSYASGFLSLMIVQLITLSILFVLLKFKNTM